MIHSNNFMFFQLYIILIFFYLLLPHYTVFSEQEIYEGNPVSPEIDSAYMKGLAYLVKTQTEEGTWSEEYGTEPGVVGLAVMAILAHGDDPNFGKYAVPINRSINFILSQMNSQNGYIGRSMYNHGFATLALAEAYGAVNNPRIGPALKKAIELIISAQTQNPHGAWRYVPYCQDADTTVTGAQMMALLAARNAGIGIPQTVIETGLKFLRYCQSSDGGIGYVGPGDSNLTRSAIGAVIFSIAKQKNTREYKAVVRYLEQARLNHQDHHFFYCLYYSALAYFHIGGEIWEKWSKPTFKYLLAAQNQDGSWNGTQGKTFSTTMALLALAVNYRFLPIYER